MCLQFRDIHCIAPEFDFYENRKTDFCCCNIFTCRSQWQRGLRSGVYGSSLAGIVGSNPTGGMEVCVDCCVMSDRCFCDGPITRPEKSYGLLCVVVCDLETSGMRRPWPALGCSDTGKFFFLHFVLWIAWRWPWFLRHVFLVNMTNEYNINVGVLTVKERLFVNPLQHNFPINMSGPSMQFGPVNFPHWLSARFYLIDHVCYIPSLSDSCNI